MIQLACMGIGYELWAETAKDAIDKIDDILAVLDKIDDEEELEIERYKKYLDPKRHDNSLPLARSNGPFGSMTIVPTADFPAAALFLTKFFVPEVGSGCTLFGRLSLREYHDTSVARQHRQ
jgi:hypothetical protein